MKKMCAIEPYDSDGYNNRIFNINQMFRIIKEILEERGFSVITFDLLNEDQVDLILVFSYNRDVLVKLQKYTCKKFYFAFEPEVVIAAHSKSNLKLLTRFFTAIYTPFDDCVDGKNIFKMNIPENLEEDEDSIPFSEKKLMCNISGYKSSKHPQELYSLRKRVIEYFKDRNDFDFYGYGDWKSLGYTNYRGEVGSKTKLYHGYKFALCVENAFDIKGYITEKIIDCLRSGIVPIYRGGEDVNQYIPEDCYIHIEDYLDDLTELDKCLRSMDETTWREYIVRGKRYLHNECEEIYSYEQFRRSFELLIDEHLDEAIRGSMIRYIEIKIFMLFVRIKQNCLIFILRSIKNFWLLKRFK